MAEPSSPARRFGSMRVLKTRNRMVLIAVDDASAAEAYRVFLDENGFSSIRVETTNELLAVANRLLPGFALVDVDAGAFGGLNLARRVRMAGSDVLLIGLMRAPTAGLERVARNAGFDAVLATASVYETVVTKLLSLGAYQGDQEDSPMGVTG